MHDFVVSSADLFQTFSYSQDVLSAKYEVDLGEDNDAIGSVGGVTYGGKRYTQVCLVSAFRSVGVGGCVNVLKSLGKCTEEWLEWTKGWLHL
jgi:hypothetical protein